MTRLRPLPRPSRRTAWGFSLIEMLIALSVLGSGLLAIAHLEVAVIQRNGSAFDAQLAVTAAHTLVERMRENRAGLAQGAYGDGSRPPPGGPDCAQAACTPAERAAWDLRQTWATLEARVATNQGFRGLADPLVQIRCADEPCAGTSPWKVTIAWSSRPGIPADDAIGLVLAP